jgi:hypothetical protein
MAAPAANDQSTAPGTKLRHLGAALRDEAAVVPTTRDQVLDGRSAVVTGIEIDR